MKNIFAIIFCSAILFGCSNSSEPETTANSTDSVIQNSEPANSQLTIPATGNSEASTTAGELANTSSPVVTAAGMNPPHGEPGHRCDINVGAPLNSAPTNSAVTTPSMQSSPVGTSPSPQSTPVFNSPPNMTPISPTQSVTVPPSSSQTVTAPGMNPPHGEPGHDCSVAVGSPLKK